MKSTTNTFTNFKRNRESKICRLLRGYTLFWGFPLKYIYRFLLFASLTFLVVEVLNYLTAFLCNVDNEQNWIILLFNKLRYIIPLYIILAYCCYKKYYALKVEILIVRCSNVFFKYEDALYNYFEYQKKARWVKKNKEEINHYQCLKEAIFFTCVNKMKQEKIYCLKKKCLHEEFYFVEDIIRYEEEENRLEEDNRLLEKEMRELGDIILSDYSFLIKEVPGSEGQKSNNIPSEQQECEKLQFSASLWSKLKRKTYQHIEADIETSTLYREDKEKIKSVFCDLFAQTSLLKI